MKQKLFLVSVVAVLLFPILLFSQTGKIKGKVVDRETGDGLPGANVSLVGTSFGGAADINGDFVILSVPVGIYTVKATFIGYRNVRVENIRVNSLLTSTVDFSLPSEAIEASEITIVAERPLVNKNATNAVRIQSYEEFKNIPIRGVGAAIALQPGVVVQNGITYIRGGRRDEVGYFLEGANVRDVTTGNNAVTVIPEALEEFQIQAGGYNAEFGGANAGIIRQQLKSGRPEYHFTIQGETDDFASEGEKFLGAYSYGYRDLTATLSGPVPGFGGKLKFFVAGQNIHENDRIHRFWEGFNFQQSDFPLIDSDSFNSGTSLYPETEAFIQSIGVVTPDGNVQVAGQNRWLGNGTLVLDSKPFIIRLGGSLSYRKRDEVFENRVPARIFNLDRVEQQELSTALVNLKVTHLISSNTFYEVNLNAFDRRTFNYDPLLKDNFWAYWDSTANADVGVDFFRNDTPATWEAGIRQIRLYDFRFTAPGTPGDYAKTKRSYYGGSFALTSQQKNHEIKLGANYERWSLRSYSINEFTALTFARQFPDKLRAATAAGATAEEIGAFRQSSGISNFAYGYDVFGNEIDPSEGPERVRHPKYFSAYLQDKFELSDLVINAGIRVDFIDNDDFEYADPANPPWDQASRSLDLSLLIDKDASVEVSPRLGLAFPVSDRTVFHMQYGKFVQAPKLNDLYAGSRYYDNTFEAQFSNQAPIGVGLDPEKTTQYEVGFSQQFTDHAAFDVTAFYKNIEDQIQISRVVTDINSPAGDYNVLINGDFATTSGVEFSVTVRRTNRISAQLNYTFSRSLGTGSVSNTAVSGIELGTEVPSVISPLDFHNPHRGSFNMDYRFGRGDGGPILERLGANLLFTFSSGHPFTLSTGDFGQQSPNSAGQITDPRSRRPLESINASLTPWNFEVNLRLDKTVSFGRFDTNFYVYATNLTNRKNVINVFPRTGNAFNDGFLEDSDLSGAIIDAQGGDPFVALHQAINLNGNGNNFSDDPGALAPVGSLLLGNPRQIRFGARFEF